MSALRLPLCDHTKHELVSYATSDRTNIATATRGCLCFTSDSSSFSMSCANLLTPSPLPCPPDSAHQKPKRTNKETQNRESGLRGKQRKHRTNQTGDKRTEAPCALCFLLLALEQVQNEVSGVDVLRAGRADAREVVHAALGGTEVHRLALKSWFC